MFCLLLYKASSIYLTFALSFISVVYLNVVTSMMQFQLAGSLLPLPGLTQSMKLVLFPLWTQVCVWELIPFMRVCSFREPSPVQCRGWRCELHGYIINSFFSYPSPPSPALPHFISFFISSLYTLAVLPHLPGCLFSLYLSKPPTFLPSLLRKMHRSLHRRFVFTDFLCSLSFCL